MQRLFLQGSRSGQVERGGWDPCGGLGGHGGRDHSSWTVKRHKTPDGLARGGEALAGPQPGDLDGIVFPPLCR